MNILLVNPKQENTLWGLNPMLRLLGKKSLQMPLGLITAAALLPEHWHLRLIDLDVQPLRDSDLRWADYVFLTGNFSQRQSVRQVIARCQKTGVAVVAGGPLFTQTPELFPDVDHLILFDAETNLRAFLSDLACGQTKRVYASRETLELHSLPLPRWDLLQQDHYLMASIQQSRGCQHRCEFCTVAFFQGPRFRTKPVGQFLQELEALYRTGWRGQVNVVDENFIGHRRHIQSTLLPAMSAWMREHGHPFSFLTSISIEIADDAALMESMAEAGFETLFIGIESPSEESLAECAKLQNRNRALLEDVHRLLAKGYHVQSGFIVGFDQDPPDIFDQHIAFIQASGVFPVVNLLLPTYGTRLYDRLKRENRLLFDTMPNQTSADINFRPRMGQERLLQGYHRIGNAIYSPEGMFQRLEVFFKHYKPRPPKGQYPVRWRDIIILLRSLWLFGVVDRGRRHFWKLLARHWKNVTFIHALSGWMMGYSGRRYHEHLRRCRT